MLSPKFVFVDIEALFLTYLMFYFPIQ